MASNYCYLNLTVSDMLRSAEDAGSTGNFAYEAHSFSRVELFGTVVSVRQYDEKSIYQIDDCTGVMACHKFQPSWESPLAPQQLDTEEEKLQYSCTSLEKLATSLEESALDRSDQFKLGDFVQIRGQLKEYRGTRRVWVHFSKILDDPNWETFYMSRQLKLYKKVYDANR